MLPALLLAGLGAATAGQGAPPASPDGLPAEIAAYYRDHNFVNAFSQRGERVMIARGLRPAVPRLTRVARAMRRLEQRVDRVDPGILGDVSVRVAPGILGHLSVRPESTYRSDLLRVTAFELARSGGVARVYLETLRLDHSANVTLVSRFEDLTAGEAEPSVEELACAAGRTLAVTFEIHRWRLVDGTWLREAATQHFLGH